MMSYIEIIQCKFTHPAVLERLLYEFLLDGMHYSGVPDAVVLDWIRSIVALTNRCLAHPESQQALLAIKINKVKSRY